MLKYPKTSNVSRSKMLDSSVFGKLRSYLTAVIEYLIHRSNASGVLYVFIITHGCKIGR